MNKSAMSRIEHLGQTGLRIDIGGLTLLVDPYLSHSVQELDAVDLVRQVPILYQPDELTMIDWVLITHEHMDHCDPQTIPAIAEASPQAYFIAPEPVRKLLKTWNINEQRIYPATTNWIELGCELKVRAVPAAHPRIILGEDGHPKAVGYLLERNGKNLWVAGDTSLCEELINSIKELLPIHAAFLPVNEDNYYRRRRGIVGNMSIREAFGLAAELSIQQVVPVHWDLFDVNSTCPDEIEAVYGAYDWPFQLEMNTNRVLL